MSLEKAEQYGRMLNEETDALNIQLKAIEAALLAKRFGVRAEVDLGNDTSLIYGKFDSQWHLIYATGEHEQLLLTATREVRIRAVSALETLLSAIEAIQNEEIARVRAATETARQLVERLR